MRVIDVSACRPDLRAGGSAETTGIRAGHILKTTGVKNGIYPLQIPLSPRIFYPEYPENPKTLGEVIRKSRMDKGLLIRELAALVGADEMTIINWELRNRRPKEKFHRSLKRELDIDIELECSK